MKVGRLGGLSAASQHWSKWRQLGSPRLQKQNTSASARRSSPEKQTQLQAG